MAKAKLSIKVNFGTVSVNKETTSVGFKFEADGHDCERIHSLMVKRRVSCKLELVKPEDLEGQQKLIEDADYTLECSADTGRISMGLDDYSGRIQVSLADHDPKTLIPFRKREGWLRIFSSGHIPEPASTP